MSAYGEFASLFQLGVGVGIGLSLFRAPVAVRISAISRKLNGELTTLKGVKTDFGKQKRRDLMALKLQFIKKNVTLDRQQFPFMILAVFGAVLNLCFLIKATLNPLSNVSETMIYVLLGISVIYFLVLIILLELLARHHLSKIFSALMEIQTRRA